MGHRNFTDGAESCLAFAVRICERCSADSAKRKICVVRIWLLSGWNSLQACIKSVARALSASFMILQIFSSVGLFFLLGGIVGMSLRTESTTSQLLAEAASAFPLLGCADLRLQAYC